MSDNLAVVGASIAYMERMFSEIDDLHTTFRAALDEAQGKPPLRFGKLTDEPDDDAYCPKGWIYNGWRWTYSVTRRSARGAPRKIGNLSLFVDLGGDGRPAASLGYPCAMVGVGWEDETDAGELWPGEEATYGVREQRLICWIDEGTTDADEWQHCRPDKLCWFYVLPLASLKNVADVRRLLVQPVVNLLSDGDVGSSFDTAKEVIRFHWAQDRLTPIP